ncbi:hypothetical protein GE09DRAFT_973174, partial [Coniochaeta sp. 2T2.1]
LPFVFIVNRTTIRVSYRFTPFYLVYGYDPVLPIEKEFLVWRSISWNKIYTIEELIEARLRILDMR